MMLTVLTTLSIISCIFSIGSSSSPVSLCPLGDEYVNLPDYGCIKGSVDSVDNTEYRSFKGIPYATPPTVENNLRFEKPVKHSGWKSQQYLEATTVGNRCMQPTTDITSISEDCLFLNIFTPLDRSDTTGSGSGSGPSGVNVAGGFLNRFKNSFTRGRPMRQKYPVMLWIHGGAYVTGSGGSDISDGSRMAVNNDVIVVSINYRLGSFGYIYSPEYGIEGSFGYYDALFAIRWVYDNIGYFGGDKDNIVVFGQSAGGEAVASILLNIGLPTQDPNFAVYDKIKGAIIQSAPFGLKQRTVDDWDTVVASYTSSAGCNGSVAIDIEQCLKTEKSSFELLNAQLSAEAGITDLYFAGQAWSPTFLSDILPQKSLLDALRTGDFNKNIPVIIGATRDDGLLFTDVALAGLGINPQTYNYFEYLFFLNGLFSFNSDGTTRSLSFLNEIEQEYRPSDVTSPSQLFDATNEILNSVFFQCSVRYAAELLSDYTNVYLYNFDYWSFVVQYLGSISGIPVDDLSCDEFNIVCHGSELPSLFLPPSFDILFQQQDIDLGKIIQSYWTNLAKIGKPGIVNGTKWDSVNKIKLINGTFGEPSMVFDDFNFVEAAYGLEYNVFDNEFNCEFWDTTDYYWITSEMNTNSPTEEPTEEPTQQPTKQPSYTRRGKREGLPN